MKKTATILLSLTLALFLAVPAMADFDPYGSVRVSTFWDQYEPDVGDDDGDVWIELHDISRFGAKFKTGDLGGRVEFGLRGSGNFGNNGVYTRLLYGTWDFGGGTLLVGQDYPAYTLTSEQVAPRTRPTSGTHPLSNSVDGENIMIGYGALWEARNVEIELKLDNGFYVELFRPATGNIVSTDDDTTLPKIVVGYEADMAENLHLNVGCAYNSYEVNNPFIGEEDIDSYMIYLGGKAALGMVDLRWNLHYGQNLTDFGLWNREEAAAAQVDFANLDIEDSDCWGGFVQAAVKVDPATITVGYGYVQSENDVLGNDTDAQQTYFAQCKVPIAETFFVVPEFSFYDGMDDAMGVEEDDEWALGMMWRMDF